MILPSKELLSEVLCKSEIKYAFTNKELLLTYYKGYTNNYQIPPINIYELMNLMKEWAYVQHTYRLLSSPHRLSSKEEYYKNLQKPTYFCSIYYVIGEDSIIQLDAETEFEAVTKACEWVLKNKQ